MKKLTLVAAAIFLSRSIFAQAGGVDLTFNPGDSGFDSGSGPDYHVLCSVLQADGKIIIGGEFFQYNAFAQPFLMRINADGTPDQSFATGIGLDGAVRAITLQSDGKVIIGGDFFTVDGLDRKGIARLNSDGSLDLSFDPGTGFDGVVYALVVRPNGDILVGGQFYSYDNEPYNHLIQLNEDGSVVTSMEFGSGPDSGVLTIHLYDDQTVLIGGYFYNFDGINSPNIAKLLPDGTLDSGFSTGSGPDWYVDIIKVQSDGKILIGGGFYSVNGILTPGLGRLFPDGSVDMSFTTGQGLFYNLRDLLILPDGSLLVGGDCYEYDGAFVNNMFKLSEDGILDPGFTVNYNIGYVNTFLLQPDGKVIVGSDWDYYVYEFQQTLIRIDQQGNKDASFNPQTGANTYINLMEMTPDNKIMIAGDFTMYNGSDVNRIARLNSDGSLDTTFDFDFVSYVTDMKILPDGKILLAGNLNGFSIMKLDQFGTPDTGFIFDALFDGDVYNITILPDGKILLTGNFSTINGVITPGIARLNEDGTLDTSFGVTSGIVGNVSYTLIQPDGKIILTGFFYEYNGTPVPQNIFRLNADGTLDSTFSFDIAPYESIYSPVMDTEGRILMGATLYDGICCYTSELIRVLPDGSIDPSFNPAEAPYLIDNITLQPDGKILFTEFGNEGSGPLPGALRRLLSDGTPDFTFNINNGPSSELSTIKLDNQGRIMVCGGFYYFGEVGRNRIARLLGETNICAQVDFLCRVNGEPIENMQVELFKVTGNNIELQGTQSTTNASGHTAYIDIPEGQYICRATPNPGIAGQENLLSTFTNETYTWQQANILEVSCGMALLDTIEIIMLPAPGSFPGSASGIVRYMTDPPGLTVENEWLTMRSFVTGDPIPGVPCIIERDTTLADQPSGVYFPFQLSMTNVGGEYGFINLPNGHYKIHVDMPGLPMAETHLFQVTDSNPEFTDLHFYVDPNDAIYIQDVISVEEINKHVAWAAFPNPFKNLLTVASQDLLNGFTYELISFEGKAVLSGRFSGPFGQIDTGDLARGIYTIRLTNETEFEVLKVIKD